MVHATIEVSAEAAAAADDILAAAIDFSERRQDVWPNVTNARMEVHALGESYAEVTEGTLWVAGVFWERCRYDWSRPGVVTATVLDSNVYRPGSRWDVRVTPREDGGSRVEMSWQRELTRGFQGRICALLYRRPLSRLVFEPMLRDVLRAVERSAPLDAEAPSRPVPAVHAPRGG